jgi:hypothetical protein
MTIADTDVLIVYFAGKGEADAVSASPRSPWSPSVTGLASDVSNTNSSFRVRRMSEIQV